MVHDQLEATSTYPWRATDPPATVYLKGADTPGTPVPPSLTMEQPQQLVLAAAPATRHKLPACLRSRTQSATPMHEKTPRWLVLTAEPVLQTKAVASVSPGSQNMPSVAAATTHAKLHDRVLDCTTRTEVILQPWGYSAGGCAGEEYCGDVMVAA